MTQKTVTATTLALLVAAVTVGFASAAKTGPDRPAGIAPEQWFPISDRLGLVLSDYQPGADPLVDSGARPPPAETVISAAVDPRREGTLPTLSGYLMVKQHNHWTRLSVLTPPACPPGIADQFCVKAAPIGSTP